MGGGPSAPSSSTPYQLQMGGKSLSKGKYINIQKDHIVKNLSDLQVAKIFKRRDKIYLTIIKDKLIIRLVILK